MRFCRHRRRPPKSQGEKHQKKRLANILGKIQLKQSMASETKGGRRGRGEKERSVRWAGSWYAGPWWTPWLLRRRMLPPRASRSFWKEERGANPRLRGRESRRRRREEDERGFCLSLRGSRSEAEGGGALPRDSCPDWCGRFWVGRVDGLEWASTCVDGPWRGGWISEIGPWSLVSVGLASFLLYLSSK